MDANASGEQLYDVLDTVEKLNFRRLFVGEDPTIFQEIFIDTDYCRLFSDSADPGVGAYR